jgi:hypothetical protein
MSEINPFASQAPFQPPKSPKQYHRETERKYTTTES